MTSKLPSPIIIDKLGEYLEGYDDKNYIINSFKTGFSINFQGEESPLSSNNSVSVSSNTEVVHQKVQSELKLGRFAGPFNKPPYENFKCSPLALREKKESGKYRILHNLSFPYDERFVNTNIPRDEATVQYASLKDSIKIIQNVSHPAYMAKSDISEAFRLIPISPKDYHLTGFFFQGYYYDRCLPMGCASSCKIFERFSTALKWILENKFGVHNVVKILDDFMFIESDYNKCAKSLQAFIKLCSDVGVPLAVHKTEGPTNVITFLSIQLNSIQMIAQLPPDKIAQYTEDVKQALLMSKITLRELKSLTGKLQFATTVVTTGKAFLRRMYNLTKGITKPFYFVRLTKGVKQDLQMWLQFLSSYNGQSFIREPHFANSEALHFFSDASKSGFGITFGSSWIEGLWPINWQHLNITILELYPIYIAISMFAHKLRNSKVIFHTDNMAVVHILNKQTSNCPIVMKIVRPFVLVLLNNNLSLHVQHIPGLDNNLCDAISRQQVSSVMLGKFNMQRHPLIIPQQLLPQNFSLD